MGSSQADFESNEIESAVFALPPDVDVTAVVLPQNWTEAAVGFEARLTGEEWNTVRNPDGTPLLLTASPPYRAGRGNLLLLSVPISGAAEIRLLSGTMAEAVSQLEAVSVSLIWRKL